MTYLEILFAHGLVVKPFRKSQKYLHGMSSVYLFTQRTDSICHLFDGHIGGVNKDSIVCLLERRDLTGHITVVTILYVLFDLFKIGMFTLCFKFKNTSAVIVAPTHKPKMIVAGFIM